MKEKNNSDLMLGFISLLFFRISLDFSYVYFINPIFLSTGFFLNVDVIKLTESYLILFLIFPFLPRNANKISNAIVYLMFIMTCLPVQSYYALSNMDRMWFYLVTSFWLLTLILNSSRMKIYLPLPPKKTFTNLMLIGGAFSVVSITLIYAYLDLSYNFDLTKVYDIRKIYAQAQIPFSGYLINWTAKIILPFIVLVSIFNKKHKISYFPLFIAIFCIIILFSSTGHKSYLFILFMIFGIAKFIKYEKFFFYLNMLCSGLILMGMFSFWLFNDLWFGSLMIRRMFFVPAKISFHYYDYFTDNYIYLSHSIFKSFIQYPYELEPAHLIGSIYMGDANTSANTGIIADAYMNFGMIGLVCCAIIFVLLLKISDSVVRSKNKQIIWSLLIITFFTMVNGALLTTVLTHGLFLAFLLAYFYPSSEKYIHA